MGPCGCISPAPPLSPEPNPKSAPSPRPHPRSIEREFDHYLLNPKSAPHPGPTAIELEKLPRETWRLPPLLPPREERVGVRRAVLTLQNSTHPTPWGEGATLAALRACGCARYASVGFGLSLSPGERVGVRGNWADAVATVPGVLSMTPPSQVPIPSGIGQERPPLRDGQPESPPADKNVRAPEKCERRTDPLL